MQILSKVIKIKNNNNPSVEYIENELKKQKINPIRWAVTSVDENSYIVSVADLIE